MVIASRQFLSLGRLAGLCLCLSLVGACAAPNPSLYDWGGYDASVARVAAPSDGFDLQAEIALLSAAMRRATDQHRQIGPGMRIHLAYLYLLQGDRASAQELLDLEMKHFPESRVFINGLMARLADRTATDGAASQSGAGAPTRQQ